MQPKTLLPASLLTLALTAAACGGGASGPPGSGRSGGGAAVAYTGPALPGLEGKPAWSAAGPAVSSALGYGNAIAVVTAPQGHYQVTVMDAATGKPLQRHALAFAGDPAGMSGSPVRLVRDTLQGRPVVVVRFDEQVPASGTQAAHEQLTDLVLDTTGRQLWRTPTTGDSRTRTERVDGGTFDGGYAVSHTTTQGTPDEESRGITVFQPVAGGEAVRVPSGYSNDDLHDIVGGTAVMSDDGLLSDGLRGVDLTQGGKTVWRSPAGEYLGAFGPHVMVSTGRRLQMLDPATGRRRSDAPLADLNGDVVFGSGFDQVRSWIYDPDTHAVIGSGGLTVIIDGDTGEPRWRQDGPNPRAMTATAAGGGVTYMALEPEPAPPVAGEPPNDGPTGFLALDTRTGKILADQLPLTAVTMTDSKHALVLHNGNLYGFRFKTGS